MCVTTDQFFSKFVRCQKSLNLCIRFWIYSFFEILCHWFFINEQAFADFIFRNSREANDKNYLGRSKKILRKIAGTYKLQTRVEGVLN